MGLVQLLGEEVRTRKCGGGRRREKKGCILERRAGEVAEQERGGREGEEVLFRRQRVCIYRVRGGWDWALDLLEAKAGGTG